MPKLCKFTSPSDGKPVYVNPDQVSVVYIFKGQPPDTIIAFRKDFLAARIGDGVITWGIPIGFGVILFTILVTGIYVRRANHEFDELSEKVKREALK